MLLVSLDIIATTYRSTIFKTHVFSLYTHLCIYVCMYLYSCPSTHHISGLAAGCAWEQFEVCLKMMTGWTQRYTPRMWSSLSGDVLRGGMVESLVIHLEAVIHCTLRWTPRSWSTEFGDALRGCSRAIVEIHLEAVIKWVWRWTWWPWSSELGDMHLQAVIERDCRCSMRPWSGKVGGRSWPSLEIQFEAMINWVWRSTWRPWSSEVGDLHLEAMIVRTSRP